ncbi:regulator of chromosome condensation 1 [Cotesia typhae]|uniref:regulator of chromosome condensation 1 n=1 Tax=Cotesia typhae TaxID=2053667 RepID=UPI003D69FA78
MPPRRGTKRTATPVQEEEVHEPKQMKKKEKIVEPDLRGIMTPGVALTFGQGDVGQLGLGEDVMEKTRPAVIPGHNDIVAIAAGGMHNVCLTMSGKVLTFGCNDEGALGRDTSVEGSETTPRLVELDGTVVQVTAGDSHSAALLDDGRVFAWGSFRDSHGGMGLTPRGKESLPIEVLPTVKIVKIASGADHLVMLTDRGRVYTCGCAEQGQLGRIPPRSVDRHSRNALLHVLTPGLVGFKVSRNLVFDDIWAGQYCTLTRDRKTGDIWAFGLNNYHQIGLKDTVPYFQPNLSKTFSNKQWKHISSGQHHTIALDDLGCVYVLGRKEYGRLGLGSNCNDATELTKVESLEKKKIIDVAAGSAQSFAITDSGELYAWGMGSSNQLGTGNEDDVDTPVLIKSKQLEGKNVVRVSGGGQHTIILAQSHPSKEKTTG